MSQTGPLDAAGIMRLATAYWDSEVLLTANRIGLFEGLGDGALDASTLADKLQLKPRPTVLFLNALVALGLLVEEAGNYRNTPAGLGLLVSDGQGYLGNSFRYSDDLYSTWGALEQALREDAPQLPPTSYLGDDAQRTRHFVYAMHDRALGTARTLVDLVSLEGRTRLLDIGGGPGTYSALFCRRYPQLRSQVLELPGVAAVAQEIIADMGLADRVAFVSGDYHQTAFPEGADVVMISGVLHRENEQVCRGLVGRAHDALAPGGMLIAADVMTDASGAAPSMAALFGLNMLLTADNGGVHSDEAVSSWLSEAGFGALVVSLFPPPMPHRVVTGVKA